MTTKVVEAAAIVVVVQLIAEAVIGAVVIAVVVTGVVEIEVLRQRAPSAAMVTEVVETGAVHLYALSAAVAADLTPFDRPIATEATEIRMQFGPQRGIEVFAART